MSAVSDRPRIDTTQDADQDERRRRPWVVILYNDDWHAFDEVILQLQKATGCPLEQAEAVAYLAHTQGRAVAHHGSFEECERAAAVLRQIRLQVETDMAS